MTLSDGVVAKSSSAAGNDSGVSAVRRLFVFGFRFLGGLVVLRFGWKRAGQFAAQVFGSTFSAMRFCGERRAVGWLDCADVMVDEFGVP